MRYAKDRKEQTRRSIVRSASRLFAAKGFEATSIDAIMRECQLTRGGFYAHFRSKGDLYRQAMQLATQAAVRRRTRRSPEWLDELIDEYLSMDGRAFFAADVGVGEPGVRNAYAIACDALIARITEQGVDDDIGRSLAAMIIGALAISSTVDDEGFKATLAAACKGGARRLVQDDAPRGFFWEGG